jgi:hypothetical protein
MRPLPLVLLFALAYRVEVPASDEIKHCVQHSERKPIGFDEVETLEFERPKLGKARPVTETWFS